MAKNFLFLEILDPEINTLLNKITEIVSGESPTKPVHLTVRGPYQGNVPQKTLAYCRDKIKYDILRIKNIGRFSNPDEEVVYFHVDSPNLRNIWYKPDYKMGEFGFNPHLSVYRGKDKNLADVVANFLECENIELLCNLFRLVPQVPKQLILLPQDMKTSDHFQRLIELGHIEETFLPRLKDLVIQYNLNKASTNQLFLNFRGS